jgi:hypothetical protein
MSGDGTVNWSYSGPPDLAVGTGATTAERALTWVTGSIGAAVYVTLGISGVLPWSWWQLLIAAVVAFDVAGGVVANTLNSCKRFFHAPPTGAEPRWVPLFRNELFFAALHVHPIIVAAFLPEGRLLTGVFWYVLLQLCVLVVRTVPLYLKRPVSFLLISIAVIVELYLMPFSTAFAWLVPFLFLKIVYGHGVREEPYRPAHEAGQNPAPRGNL